MSLILGGAVVDEPGLRSKSFFDHGMSWPVGTARVKRRASCVDLGVLHATGGEGPAKQVFRTLSARGYSVEFCLDRDGLVWQFLDPLAHSAAHTGGLNARSLGIEVVNSMRPYDPAGKRPKSEAIYQVVSASATPGPDYVLRKGRKCYYLCSRRKTVTGLYPVQLEALRLLVRILSDRTAIPHWPGSHRDYVPVGDRKDLRGWIAHSAATLRHADPSLDSIGVF